MIDVQVIQPGCHPGGGPCPFLHRDDEGSGEVTINHLLFPPTSRRFAAPPLDILLFSPQNNLHMGLKSYDITMEK
jgi:hypothetical protein